MIYLVVEVVDKNAQTPYNVKKNKRSISSSERERTITGSTHGRVAVVTTDVLRSLFFP